MEPGHNADTIYEAPKAVAERLGVSASGLRRLAAIYEEVFGPLPKDSMGGRMWSPQAVARLESAKALVEAGRVKSTKEALERPPDEVREELEALPPKIEAADALVLVLQELKAMREELERAKGGKQRPTAATRGPARGATRGGGAAPHE